MMKKIATNSSSGNMNHGQHDGVQERSKKLYKSISETARKLDDARGCAQTIADLFKPPLLAQRTKFKDYCEQLIFSEPDLYSRKAEDLLWRKVYYDVISTAKQLKKSEYSKEESCRLLAHLNSGIGHYQHFILKLQSKFGVDLADYVDFPILDAAFESNAQNWVRKSVYTCLVYLGDLNRYKLEIFPNWGASLAVRYYQKAVSYNPDYGIPHNQMGTLASTQNNLLDATYHYLRSISCKHSFEGTENNLHRLFEKNSQLLEQIVPENTNVQIEQTDHVKRLVCRFLFLVDAWFFNKSVSDIYILCHQTSTDLQECLSNPNETDSDAESNLTDEMIFKIVAICLLCVSKPQKQFSTAVAFTLAVYSQLLHNAIDHIQEGIINTLAKPEKQATLDDANAKKRVRGRRKKKKVESDEESDASDLGEASEISDSDIEGFELICSSSENESDNENESKEVIVKPPFDYAVKSKQIPASDMLEIISEEKLLNSIKILSDWLTCDSEIIKSCGKNTRSLFKQIVKLLNLLNHDFETDYHEINEKVVPLPEDDILKGVEILSISQKELDWSFIPDGQKQSLKFDVVVRAKKLVAFGCNLAKMEETGVSYDETSRVFTVTENPGGSPTNQDSAPLELTPNRTDKDNDSKEQLTKMKHMGHLWLAAEVRALENRVRGKSSLSPYLVLDADALTNHITMVKQLVNSRKFIVVIPSAVVSVLDDMKRENSEARDAIRWLESQFQLGNRYFRAQRPNERTPIPFIKYPKKKDRDMHAFIQVIECCHFLAQQQKNATNLVTLLVGNCNVQNKELSYTGLAESAGITLQLVTEFYGKWKRGYKGKR